MTLTASSPFGAGSGVLAVAGCAGCEFRQQQMRRLVQCGNDDREKFKSFPTCPGPPLRPVAAPVTSSGTVAASALATTILPVTVVCGGSARSVSAATDAARLSSIGITVSMPAEPKQQVRRQPGPRECTTPPPTSEIAAGSSRSPPTAPPMLHSQA